VAQVELLVSQAVVEYASGSPPHVFQPAGGAAVERVATAREKKSIWNQQWVEVWVST
jgi:hypothetical protein